MKATIVMPAFNEEQAIASILNDIKTSCHNFVEEIIVVDDGSTDNTASVAEKEGVHVIRHVVNKGYGASLATGIRCADTEFVITIDADGQHRVEDILNLCRAAEEYDMVVGQRTQFISGPFWRMPGKWLLGALASYLTGRVIPDLNSGLRRIRKDIALKYLHLCPQGFSFLTTITLAFISRGYNVIYIPIRINKRIGKSKVSIATGVETLILIFRITSLFNPLRIFIPVSFAISVLGVLWGMPYILRGHGVSIGTMLAIITSLLFFGLGLICDQISQLRLERFE